MVPKFPVTTFVKILFLLTITYSVWNHSAIAEGIRVNPGDFPQRTSNITVGTDQILPYEGTYDSHPVNFNKPLWIAGASSLAIGAETKMGKVVKNDFNGDGTSDILWRNAPTGAHGLWFVRLDGTRLSCKAYNTSQYMKIAGTGDFNGDGISDVIWRDSSTGGHVLWFIGSDGTRSSYRTYDTSRDMKIMGTGDFNGDGRCDILWENTATGKEFLWFIRSDGARSSYRTYDTSRDVTIVGTGDFNGDGLCDILWENASNGKKFLWFIRSNGTISSYRTYNTGRDMKIAGTGDFNGDGLCDILWENISTGKTYLWFMSLDGARLSYRTYNTSRDMKIVGTGDFNGDGLCDILWENISTGKAYLWFMDSDGTRSSSVTLQTDPDWTIAGDKARNYERPFSFMEISATQGYEAGAVHSLYGLYRHTNPSALVYGDRDQRKLLLAYQESDFASYGTAEAVGCDSYFIMIDLFTLELSGPYKIGDTLRKGDPHGGPAIIQDNAGYVHIFYGSHHSSQLWTRTKKKVEDPDFLTGSKYSMTDFESPKTIGADQTYPQLVYNHDILWLFTRGPLTAKCWNLYVQNCSNPQGAWNELNFSQPVQLTEFTGYLGSKSGSVLLRGEPLTDSEGNIHVIFGWRDNKELELTRPIFYAKYCSAHGRWEKSNGEAYQLPITPETVEIIYSGSGIACEHRGKANGIDSSGNIFVLFFLEEKALLIRGKNGNWSQPVEIAKGSFGALAIDDQDYIHLYINSETDVPGPHIAHYVSTNHGMAFELEKKKRIDSKPGDSYLTDHFLIFSREVDGEKNVGVVDILNLNFF